MQGRWLAVIAVLAAVRAAAQPTAALTLSIEEAERLALSNSDDVRIQGLQLQSAARRFELGVRDFLPQMQLGVSSSNTVNVGAQDSPSKQVSVTLRQPVYNGGRAVLQRSLSRLQLTLSRRSLESTRADLLNDVWDKFQGVLVLEAQRAVKNETLEHSRQQLQIARRERELGITREIDLLDVELSVSNQETALESADSDVEQALYALKKCLGLSPEQDLRLAGSIDSHYQGFTIGNPVSYFIGIARANNLDLQSAAFTVTQAEAQAAIARSQYLPQIDANLSLTLSGARLPLQTPGVSLGVDVSFPQSVAPVKTSVSGGMSGSSSTQSASMSAAPLHSVTAGLDDADAALQVEAARAALQVRTRDVDFQVGQLLAAYQRQNAAVQQGRRSLDLEEKKLRILSQQVADGSATRVDLLKEETQAADMEVQILSGVRTLLRTEKTLERLLGMEPGSLARILGGASEGS
jgi:outer membrane protein